MKLRSSEAQNKLPHFYQYHHADSQRSVICLDKVTVASLTGSSYKLSMIFKGTILSGFEVSDLWFLSLNRHFFERVLGLKFSYKRQKLPLSRHGYMIQRIPPRMVPLKNYDIENLVNR